MTVKIFEDLIVDCIDSEKKIVRSFFERLRDGLEDGHCLSSFEISDSDQECIEDLHSICEEFIKILK